jgi:hypothetical protein
VAGATMKPISKQAFYKVIYDGDMDICVNSKSEGWCKRMTTKFTFRNGKLFGMAYTDYNDIDSNGFSKVTYEIVDEYYPTQETTNEN